MAAKIEIGQVGGRMASARSELKTTTADTAQYIGGMAKELRALAAKSELGFLAYLLAMVEQEAEKASQSGGLVEGKSGASG